MAVAARGFGVGRPSAAPGPAARPPCCPRARGGADRGRTFGTYLRLRAQKPLSGFCSRPMHGGSTAVEQPGRERCSAARRRSLEQRRPSAAFGRRRRSRDRESMQCRSMNLGIVRTCKAAGSAHAPPVPSVTALQPALEMTRPIRTWARNNHQATMCYRLFLLQTMVLRQNVQHTTTHHGFASQN